MLRDAKMNESLFTGFTVFESILLDRCGDCWQYSWFRYYYSWEGLFRLAWSEQIP